MLTNPSESMRSYGAVVVGSGPNGLAAAITLARAGRPVLVLEAAETVGGGTRSGQLTLPGFLHDICSAVHPLGLGSPFFRKLPLSSFGLEWIQPGVPLAHPFDDGTAAVLYRSVDATAEALGSDRPAYAALMRPLVADWPKLAYELLGPLRPPRYPLAVARFGLHAIRSARGLAESLFRDERTRALFAGIASHSMLPLDQAATASFGLILAATAHSVGWPVVRSGSQQIADSLSSYLRSLHGEIVTGTPVRTADELPAARSYLFDVTPRQLLALTGTRLSGGYRRELEQYRYGPGAFKVDWALDGPVPWTAAGCRHAGTVHLGGTLGEISDSAHSVARGMAADKPFVVVAQQSLFDPSRAPEGKQTLWSYCHVPNGSTFDMTERIEAQIERFAPGFRDRILARHVMTPCDFEHHNANYVGGDINGGLQDLRQLFTRPAVRIDPYSTPAKGMYICSSSTPPGGGVHGMCGYHAALSAMRHSS